MFRWVNSYASADIGIDRNAFREEILSDCFGK